MTRRRGTTTAAIALALLMSVVPGANAAGSEKGPETRCRRGMMTTVDTFYVEIDWGKKKYSPGEAVKVTVRASRPGEEDPLNNGIPLPAPQRLPAEGVDVTGAFFINPPYYPFGTAVTDSEGVAKLSIKLPKNFKGPVDTHIRVWKLHNANGPACSEVLEETIINQARTLKVS